MRESGVQINKQKTLRYLFYIYIYIYIYICIYSASGLCVIGFIWGLDCSFAFCSGSVRIVKDDFGHSQNDIQQPHCLIKLGFLDPSLCAT